MRPRYQSGSIVEKNGNWIVRYYEDRVDETGQHKRVRTSKVLAPVGGAYRTKTQVRHLADEKLESVRTGRPSSIDGTLMLSEFIEKRYFPHLEDRLKMAGALHLEHSTIKGYRDIWRSALRIPPSLTFASVISGLRTHRSFASLSTLRYRIKVIFV